MPASKADKKKIKIMAHAHRRHGADQALDADQALGVPWVNAASRVLARSKQSDHLLVQDGEANVTYIRGKRTIDMSFS